MKSKIVVFAFLVSIFSLGAQAQTSFRVTVKGKGSPVLLFAGFGCTGEVWNETVAELSKKHECHIFTFAGFGGVPAIETPWLSSIKDEVIQYVKTKKLKKPTLMGHSLGGTLSLWLAALEKEMFKQIVVVDALPCSAALMIPNYKGEKLPYENPRNKMMLDMNQEAFAKMNTQMTNFMCKNKEKQKVIVDWMNLVDRKTYVYGYVDMLNLDLREEIAKITIPVTILAATNPDLTTVEKTYKAQYEKLPSVKIHYAENAAHFVMYDQPEWFMQKVKEIIQ